MKSLEEFVELFTDLFEETDPSTVKPDTNFRSIDEWSSLIALSVIAMVDEEFDVTLRGADVRESDTVEDLYNKIVSKL